MLDQTETRKRAAHRLWKAFEKRSMELDVEPIDIDVKTLGAHLEICAWNSTLKHSTDITKKWSDPRLRYRFTTKIIGLERNILDPKNPELARKLLRREVGLKTFATMLPWEMAPERWEKAFDVAALRQIRKIFPIPKAEECVNGIVQCRKCHSNKTSWTELQTRSADEPATIFFFCNMCGNRWKG